MLGSSLKLVELVAERLGPELRSDVAFLGGATIELLPTDPAVDEVRVTKDVDVITAGRSRAAFLVGFSERLRARGFREGGEGAHRWKIADLIVDVMPVEEDILGFSNRWYPAALARATLSPAQRHRDQARHCSLRAGHENRGLPGTRGRRLSDESRRGRHHRAGRRPGGTDRRSAEGIARAS
jgi:hypothetical protein